MGTPKGLVRCKVADKDAPSNGPARHFTHSLQSFYARAAELPRLAGEAGEGSTVTRRLWAECLRHRNDTISRTLIPRALWRQTDAQETLNRRRFGEFDRGTRLGRAGALFRSQA